MALPDFASLKVDPVLLHTGLLTGLLIEDANGQPEINPTWLDDPASSDFGPRSPTTIGVTRRSNSSASRQRCRVVFTSSWAGGIDSPTLLVGSSPWGGAWQRP